MLFLGIDFGWMGKPTGLAALAWSGDALRFISMERRTGLSAVLEFVDQHSGYAPAMIAVDAPTVIPNATGMRDADKLMHRHFGRFHAGAYPANLGRPHAARTVELGNALVARGFLHSATMQARQPGRYQIEVHPHAATIELFDLPRILKYKRGRVAARKAELTRYRELCSLAYPGFPRHCLIFICRIFLREVPPSKNSRTRWTVCSALTSVHTGGIGAANGIWSAATRSVDTSLCRVLELHPPPELGQLTEYFFIPRSRMFFWNCAIS